MSFPVQAPLICIVGPTASGKSAAARAIAQRWPVEIINVDSATIYRGMDIGTAKPTVHERNEITHHLLDILDPADSYSVANFRRDALQCVRDIQARGHLPLLVGGTMMYFKALRDGLNDLPAADPEIRKILEARAAAEGWPAMHARLKTIDPLTAQRLSPNDSQRVGRALEIWQISGQPMSALLGATQPADAPIDTITISLEPLERSLLHTRIAERFDQMLERGLITEVQALHARGDLHPGLPSIRCVGYRQLWSMLAGELDLKQAREQAISATRQLAKRQITWLRSQPERHSIDACSPNAIDQVVQAITEFTGRPSPQHL
jgi:tRNA dimethylallyltransferase